MQRYVWKHFPGSEDWVLVKKGEEPREDEKNCLVILSRMNRYFPWSIYTKGRENKKLESEVPSDSLKDIKDYILAHIEDILNEKLTEADEDNIMSDDELDELDRKERDEFEAKLKARRDKVAQDRFARDERIRQEQEVQRKAGEVLDKIGETREFEELFDILVPNSGKCETVAGELIRAANKIEYRFFNDGDRFFEDYGIETCGPCYKFIVDNVGDSRDEFYQIFEKAATSNADDSQYEEFITILKSKIIDYIFSHKETFGKEPKDMLDNDWKEVEEEFEDNEWIPTYECDADIPDELQAHLDKGNVDERDVQWEVESWLENMGDYKADVSVSGYVYVEGMKKSSYDEMNGNLYRWLEQYGEDLTKQYGDPSEEEESEDEEEEE